MDYVRKISLRPLMISAAAAIAAIGGIMFAAPAEAGDRHGRSYGHGHGHQRNWDRGHHRGHHYNRNHYRPRVHYSYVAPRPVYYQPAPVYYAPQPVYYAPRPAYYAPRPAYSGMSHGGYSSTSISFGF